MVNMSNILVTHNIQKAFGGVMALDGVNMEVENGSVTMLMGPNGSGKTTLINPGPALEGKFAIVHIENNKFKSIK